MKIIKTTTTHGNYIYPWEKRNNSTNSPLQATDIVKWRCQLCGTNGMQQLSMWRLYMPIIIHKSHTEKWNFEQGLAQHRVIKLQCAQTAVGFKKTQQREALHNSFDTAVTRPCHAVIKHYLSNAAGVIRFKMYSNKPTCQNILQRVSK